MHSRDLPPPEAPAAAENDNGAGSAIIANIPASSSWTQATFASMPVSNGQCEIGFYSDAGAWQYVHMDDVELFQR